MPLHAASSLVLGPTATSGSSPSTLSELLDSFGVTWYGGFRRGLLQYSVAANQDTPATSEGNSVGQWCASWTAGGFSAKWVQTSNSKRPTYMTSWGTQGIMGDATSTWLQLDSTTELNRDHTVLIAVTMPILSGARAYSHNNNRMAVVSATSLSSMPTIYSNNLAGQQASPVMETTTHDATASHFRLGWRSGGTGHYDTVPNLLRGSNATNYSESLLTEVWLIGAHLTNDQICQCLPFLVI
jgi:hypothetical protein